MTPSSESQPTALYSQQAVPPLSQTQLRPLVGGRDPAPDAQGAIPVENSHSIVTPDGQRACLELPPGSQHCKFLSQGTESPNESNAVSRLSKGPVRSGRTGQCKLACIHCRKAAKRCDSGRSCSRCLRLGLQGCRDAPVKRRKSTVNRNGVPPVRTLIHSETTFIEEHQHWQQVTYDPVSGAAWSTIFMSTEVRATSAFIQTQFSPLYVQIPAYHGQPVQPYAFPSTLDVGMPGGLPPQCPCPLVQGANCQMVHPTAYNHRVDAQMPRYRVSPRRAPQIEAPHRGIFHDQPYPQPGAVVEPRSTIHMAEDAELKVRSFT